MDLPDGVLSRIFAELSASPSELVLTGRAVERACDALALAHASRRHLDVFRASLRSVRLDGSENPVFDSDERLAALLRLARPHMRELSLRWFERATLRPALFEAARAPHLRALALHGVGAALPPADLVALLAAAAPRLESLSLVCVAWFSAPGANADAALYALAHSGARLRSFELAATTALSHNALVAVWRASGDALNSVDLHDVAHPTVGDHTLLALAAHCKQVRALNIASVRALSATALAQTCAALRATLEELCVESHDAACSAVSDLVAERIVQDCPLLTSVCFSKPRIAAAIAAADHSTVACWKRTSADPHAILSARWALAAGAALGARLRKLSVYDPTGLGDVELRALARACPNLSSVGLRACAEVTSAGLEAVAASSGSRLRSIDISGCVRVCDAGVRAVARYCGPQLEFVWLADLPLVTLRALRALLRAAAPALKDVNLSAGRFAPAAAARTVRTSCAGARLECVVLDYGAAVADRESTYEVERLRGGVRCIELRDELEQLRDACPNAVIVLEKGISDGVLVPNGTDYVDAVMGIPQTAVGLHEAMMVEM